MTGLRPKLILLFMALPAGFRADVSLINSPAAPHLEFKRSLAAVNRIPRLLKTLQGIEARLMALENALGERRVTGRSSDPLQERGSG